MQNMHIHFNFRFTKINIYMKTTPEDIFELYFLAYSLKN